MAEQKLIATGECRLGTGDMFELAEKAKHARHVCDQAAKEIQKTFPDFKFIFTTANYRDPSAPRPGRRAAGAQNTGQQQAAGEQTSDAATQQANGADKSADAGKGATA